MIYNSTLNFEKVYDDIKAKLCDPNYNIIITPKVHGTNASLKLTKDRVYFRSRHRVVHNCTYIELETYNGECKYGWEAHDNFAYLFRGAGEKLYNIFTCWFNNYESIEIFGEYFGQGIQNGSGVFRYPKTFMPFAIKVNSITGESVWYDNHMVRIIVSDKLASINNVISFTPCVEIIPMRFRTSEERVIKYLEDARDKVEKNCPIVSLMHRFHPEIKPKNTIGEGIVVLVENINDHLIKDRLIFKMKGTEHSKNINKEKLSKPLTSEHKQQLLDFANLYTYEWRLNQFLDNSFNDKDFGKYIGLISKDIFKEETFNGLEISKQDRKYFNMLLAEICKSVFFNRIINK